MVKRHNKKQSLVANASVQFTLYPLLKAWAAAEASDCRSCLPHLAVYNAACDVIDVIKKVKHRQITTADAQPQLLTAYKCFLDLHKAQYGTRFIKPKFCWMWSIAMRIADSPWLFDMFAIERQHQRVRAQAELVKNTVTFEKSVLHRVLDAQVIYLAQNDPLEQNNSAMGIAKEYAGFGIVGSTSPGCICDGKELYRNDIVMDRQSTGVILECIISDDGRMFLIVEELQRDGNAWRQTPLQQCWRTSRVHHPAAWCREEDGRIFLIT